MLSIYLTIFLLGGDRISNHILDIVVVVQKIMVERTMKKIFELFLR